MRKLFAHKHFAHNPLRDTVVPLSLRHETIKTNNSDETKCSLKSLIEFSYLSSDRGRLITILRIARSLVYLFCTFVPSRMLHTLFAASETKILLLYCTLVVKTSFCSDHINQSFSSGVRSTSLVCAHRYLVGLIPCACRTVRDNYTSDLIQ